MCDLVVLDACFVALGGQVAVEARACFQVEAPAVEDADERRAEDLALAQRIALVRAAVLERVDPALDAEEHHVAPVERHDGAVAAVQDGHGHPVRFAHAPRLGLCAAAPP